MASQVLHNRFLGFLIWQLIQSSALFALCKILLLSPFTSNPFLPSLFGFAAFLAFLLSMALFAVAAHTVSTPRSSRAASLLELSMGLLRFVLTASLPAGDFRLRARVSLEIALLVCASAVSGSLAAISVLGSSYRGSFADLISEMGYWGFVVGLVFGFYYVYKQRWVLVFPIIQRPPFFSYKIGVPSAISQALKVSAFSYLWSAMLLPLFGSTSKKKVAVGVLVAEQLMFYIGSFVVVLCWELIHHLHQVLHTKRFTFAPPKGSAAAESNPSEMLLASLEDSRPRCLLQYLAYHDLSMVCGNNIDTWRRAAFYEETGETYKRVVAVCLRPLDQLASCLSERVDGSSDNAYKLSDQLCSPEDVKKSFELVESFNDFQLYAWCAQAGAALTVHSHKEDRFGVAQISGSHSAVLSTLLSSLLAVETFMGKKTNLQSPNHLLGPAGIKWATNSASRREISMAVNKKRDSPLYSKAYALADILKTSIYCIVSEFHDEMIASAKAGFLDKDWVINTKPAYGSRDLLLQKLKFFLNFQAS